MAKEYKVNLDALDQVVRELNDVLKDMNGTKGKAGSGTFLPVSALGAHFNEREELNKEHEAMKKFIEQDILDRLEKMIDKFGKKTKKVKEHYDDAEHANKMQH
ncbi:hypothetical protein [Streptomyces sp. NPDC048650]|uniref:hypothetical protein n=1 Tax=unclassified Streptomyces TaxID=2593676 RepID=UPI003713B19D